VKLTFVDALVCVPLGVDEVKVMAVGATLPLLDVMGIGPLFRGVSAECMTGVGRRGATVF
jgi:hypothetical protein